MTRKKNRGGKERRKNSRLPEEDRRAEAATIAWMLTAVATLAAELFALVAVAAVRWTEAEGALRVLPAALLFVALITGAVCLLMTPVVYRFRRTRPPMAITAFAVMVGAAPIVAIGVIAMLAR